MINSFKFVFSADFIITPKETISKSYSTYCDSTKYWPDNCSYYDYPMVSNNGFNMEPDYVGMVVNKSFKQIDMDEKDSESESIAMTSSSEIVDLDTKEIRTVKTEINSSLNQIIKKDTKTSTDNNQSSSTKSSPQQTAKDEKETEKEFPKVKSEDGIPYEWAIDLMKKYKPGLLENSPKMEIFFSILNESIQLGDRVLLFSQSLLTLNLIEQFLMVNKMPSSDICWMRNTTYFRKFN